MGYNPNPPVVIYEIYTPQPSLCGDFELNFALASYITEQHTKKAFMNDLTQQYPSTHPPTHPHTHIHTIAFALYRRFFVHQGVFSPNVFILTSACSKHSVPRDEGGEKKAMI